MKILKRLTVIAFCFIIIIPVLGFSFEEHAISEIDNRELAGNPFDNEDICPDNFAEYIDDYINDRIGFRDRMISDYIILNDLLFRKMDHPIYTYGTDGYVFGGGLLPIEYGEYHIAFANMVRQIQNYCEERGVPFLFVFDPAKPAVYSEYISGGINFNRDWVELLFDEFDNQGVNYLDNTGVLIERKNAGDQVFNVKYDANHWNDLGAFYGTREMLERIKEFIPEIHINSLDEFEIGEKHEDTLPVSKFPIDEMVPVLTANYEVVNKYDEYSGLELHPDYRGFGYYVNEERIKENSPRALVFQGSYMNSYGYKFMINSLGEYIHVHDYQNVINFPYYFNIFKPDCVIFEAAEYTIEDGYFSLDKINRINYQPTAESAVKSAEKINKAFIPADSIAVETQGGITTVYVSPDAEQAEYAWLILDDEYDMEKTESGYMVSLSTEKFEAFDGNMVFVLADGAVITEYTAE